ncbi:hypothetical protein ACHAW5_005500 [Stephanodiscus triporus]|uniref:FHA domain-containing protein n=1 Tax=Stephanodiscus triporus TaxID=2934178 RepID=A0ABD3MH36_9STRA
MLLRVTKVSGGNTAADPRPSPDPPLHACLSTAVAPERHAVDSSGGSLGGSQLIGGVPHAVVPLSPPPNSADDFSGEILTVGRKDCAVTLEDKCVSRTHATIALLSNRPPMEHAGRALLDGLLDDGRVMMEYGTPSTPEEKRACEASTSGVICVVRDKGSKFGTYVSVDETLSTGCSRGSNDDDDETGDETDDGGDGAAERIGYVELTEKQIRAVRLLSDDDGTKTTAPPKFQRLGENQSRPLPQLSHSGTGSRHAIVLFGPQGSAIRLSLVPLTLTFSRVKAPELDPILASLQYVGASHSLEWDVRNSTHLVAPEKTAAAKGIMAWACRRPVVTTGFVEALLRRRDAREGLPREEDYRPKGTWDANLKYTPEPSTALRGYLIAVMVDDDNAPLAQSAGAEVLPIHEEAPSSSRAEFESWWQTRTQKALANGLAVAVVASSSKRCKHFADWLRQDEGVRFTNAKNIAKAITNNNGEGDLLLDVDKAVIEKVGRPPEAGLEGVPGVDSTYMSTMAEASAESPEDAVETFENTDATENHFPPNDEIDVMPVSTRRKRPQEEELGNIAKHLGGEEQQPDRQKRRRKNQDEEALAKEVGRGEEDIQAEEPVAAAINQEKVVDESSDDEPGLPAERMPLPTSEDGWLIAAPKRRKAFRKGRDEDFGSAAETEKVSGLIVREYIPPNRGSRGRGATVGRATSKKKDFKRCKRTSRIAEYPLLLLFRKNSVLLGYTTFNPNGGTNQNHNNVPKIRLVDVLPKESARQLLLQQQQENLEREQELADHLFNDGGAVGGRKHGGGNMLSYLSQSTTNRGRGRR